jgi:predicted nucleotidyltransferase
MGPKLSQDFREFFRLLNANGVEYLLIGGYAVAYYGYPRTTNDIDIWIARRPDNARRMILTLQQFGFESSELTEELFLREQTVVRMGMPPMRIEVLTTISGIDFEQCYGARVNDTIDGQEVSVISLEHLKINKAASGRHKDLDDLEHLP